MSPTIDNTTVSVQSAETEPWSLYIRSAHPQCAAGMQSISETDAAATPAEWGHFEHLL